MYQRTIKNEFEIYGTGIHSGEKAKLIFKPAPVDRGIVFFRTDLPACPSVSAVADNVISTFRSTDLKSGEAEVKTVEHLMSALCGLHIDNVEIEITGPEIPIMDGSAHFFVERLLEADFQEQREGKKKFFSCEEPVWVTHKGSHLVLLPCEEFKITYIISYDHPILKTQMEEIEVEPRTYIESISRARTYAFMNEVKYLLDNNLALGGSLENALIIKDDGFSTDLRYSNEPVRHKILDLIGDLYLLGRPLKGHLLAVKSGHKLNFELVKKLREKYF